MPPSAPSPNQPASFLRADDEAEEKKNRRYASPETTPTVVATPSQPHSTETAAANTTTATPSNGHSPTTALNGDYHHTAASSPSLLGFNNLAPYGTNFGGMYGMGGGGGYGMIPPYGGGGAAGMMMMGMGGGPLSGLTQFLMGVQNVVFSLGQAVQIVGLNAEAVQHLLESVVCMFDHAAATWHEMQRLEVEARVAESDEMKIRRRRLRALRWALSAAATYAGYAVIRKLLLSLQGRRRRPPAIATGFQPQNRAYNHPPPPPTAPQNWSYGAPSYSGEYGSYSTTAGPYNSGYGGVYF